jgi:adenylate cyclase
MSADPLLVRATVRRLAIQGWIAGTVGAWVVFAAIALFTPVFTGPGDRGRLALVNAPILVVYGLLGGLALTWALVRHARAALGWIADGRSPEREEHERTLRLAARIVEADALAWIAGAFLFAAVDAAVESWAYAAVAFATIWLGGETTCALRYLLSERALRPVTGLALAERRADGASAPGVPARLLMAWALGTGVPLVGVIAIGVVGLTRSGVATTYVSAAVLFLAVVAAVAGLLVMQFAARAIADPLRGLRQGLERVEGGDFDASVAVDDGSEVGMLQTGFNRMAEGLRERQRIRDLFGRHVGEAVARTALRESKGLGGEEREIGALFVDIVGSTALAATLPPADVVRLLNRFFRVVVEVVERHGGLVNKFEGDAALCVFGAPVTRRDPAGDALSCARHMAARLGREVPEIDFGIGISAGVAVAGNVGAERRFEYTVIGDPVNEAARLAELSKERPERVLAAASAVSRTASASEAAAWTVGDAIVLRGRGAPTGLARPVAVGGAAAAQAGPYPSP